jgi:hypothetical protein
MQQQLPLDTDLVNLMMSAPKPIGWRRAHTRETKRGTIKVALTILNGDKSEKERMLLGQLPEGVKTPQAKSGAAQLALEI